jgi:hypothetical protein
VHFCLYEIEKSNGKNTSYLNFGEAAFHGREGLDTSNFTRLEAIERCLLREVHSLLKANQGLEAMDLFEGLSADPWCNSTYGELYTVAQKRGIKTNHSDFGKMAFHRLEGYDVPDDLRLEAIESCLSKTVKRV